VESERHYESIGDWGKPPKEVVGGPVLKTTKRFSIKERDMLSQKDRIGVTIVMAGVMGVCASVQAGTVTEWAELDGGNGHYYQYIDSSETWKKAKDKAPSFTFDGMRGHLVTVTSEAEENFIKNEVATGRFWAAGSDQETEGTWQWEVGPEAGTTFYTERGGNQAYANWNTGEPNDNRGEDALLVVGSGWNDLSVDDPARNYVVEYSAVPTPTGFAGAVTLLGLLVLGNALRRSHAPTRE
jgi:hypothetical protein